MRTWRGAAAVAVVLASLTSRPALAQHGPPFEIGTSGWPENMLEVAPRRKSEATVLPAQRYWVWLAAKEAKVSFRNWKWTRFGPYDLAGGQRYRSHVGSAGYIVAPEENAALPRLGGTETALSFDNVSPRWMALITAPVVPVSVASPGADVDVSGVWLSTADDPNVSDATFTFSRTGSGIRVEAAFKFKGYECRWHGTGTLHGRELESSVTYDREHPDWTPGGADGRMVMTVSPDGQSMTGHWYNKLGQEGSITYRRAHP